MSESNVYPKQSKSDALHKTTSCFCVHAWFPLYVAENTSMKEAEPSGWNQNHAFQTYSLPLRHTNKLREAREVLKMLGENRRWRPRSESVFVHFHSKKHTAHFLVAFQLIHGISLNLWMLNSDEPELWNLFRTNQSQQCCNKLDITGS